MVTNVKKKLTPQINEERRVGESTLRHAGHLSIFFLSFSVHADDPSVNIIETNPLVNSVTKEIISEKNKDVQLTCVVENKPIGSEVKPYFLIFGFKNLWVFHISSLLIK